MAFVVMPKKDSYLDSLNRRFHQGSLYCFDNEQGLNLWSLKGSRKFARKLQSGETVMFLGVERSKTTEDGYRVSLIRGEDIGYVLMKRYEVIGCLKPLDTEAIEV